MERNTGLVAQVPTMAAFARPGAAAAGAAMAGAATGHSRGVPRAVPPPGGPDRHLGPVRVLAHRGSAGPQRRDNSVRAVEAALERGADGVEVDVRLSADGALVCSHDPVLRTPSGERLVVAGQSSAELRRAALRAGWRLATLEEVLVVASRRGPCHVVVEAKPVADGRAAEATARALRAALRGAEDTVTLTVSSFDRRLLAVVREALAASGVRTAVLGHRGEPAHAVLTSVLDAGHDEAHIGLAALRRAPHAVRLARRLGVAVTAWTVNGRDDLRRVAEWGVDAVITDNVALGRAVLDRAPDPAGTPLDLAAC